MSAKTTELKPCPFCGSGNVRYKEAEHAVVCARYKAVGNSMAVPVMRWIGERIAMAEAGEIS